MAEQSYSSIRTITGVNTSGAYVGIAIDGTAVVRIPPILSSFKITALVAGMQTAYTGATATVMTVTREIKMGTATSAVTIGTLTIPITAALGDVYVVDVSAWGDTELAPGESILFTSDGGADATTTAWFGIRGYEYPEIRPTADYATIAKPRSGVGSVKYLAGSES